MDASEILNIRDIIHLQGLYWTKFEDEQSNSDTTASESRAESSTSVAFDQGDLFPAIETFQEKSKEKDEEQEPSVFEGQGMSSLEIPQPTTPYRRVTRSISGSPTTPRICTPLPDPYSSPSPSLSGDRSLCRRLVFDRVLDLSSIQSRTRDGFGSPKQRIQTNFAENGDVILPKSESMSPTKQSSPLGLPLWQPRLSTPRKMKKSAASRTESWVVGWNGDFMASEGGLGARAASWGL